MRFKKDRFDQNEAAQLSYLQTAARQHLGEGVTTSVLFTPEEKEGRVYVRHKPQRSSFNCAPWISQLGNQPLRANAEQAINSILAYQRQRISRLWWNSGYIDEPNHLCLEEMKSWLVQASVANCNDALLQQIKSRSKYLKSLIFSDVFLPEHCKEGTLRFGLKSESKTMYWVLIEVQTILVKMKRKVQREILARSSRERFSEMRNLSEQAIDQLTGSLFYMFKETVSIEDFSRENLLYSTRTDYMEFRKTIPGRCLFELAKSLREISASDELEKLAEFENPFISKSNSGCLPAALSKGRKMDVFKRAYWEKSGIERAFLTEEIIEVFLAMHGLIIELAKQNRIWSQAHDLAGKGGDFIIYSAANEVMASIFTASERLLSLLQSRFARLQLAAQDKFIKIYEKNSRAIPWVENHKLAISRGSCAKRSIKKMLEVVAELGVELNRLTPEERRHDLDRSLSSFEGVSTAYIKRVETLIGEKILSEQAKRISSSKIQDLDDELACEESVTTDKEKVLLIIKHLKAHEDYLKKQLAEVGYDYIDSEEDLGLVSLSHEGSGENSRPRLLIDQLRVLSIFQKILYSDKEDHRKLEILALKLKLMRNVLMKHVNHPKFIRFLELVSVLTLGVGFLVSVGVCGAVTRGKKFAFWRPEAQSVLNVCDATLPTSIASPVA